jgi:hypothetical protein
MRAFVTDNGILAIALMKRLSKGSGLGQRNALRISGASMNGLNFGKRLSIQF